MILLLVYRDGAERQAVLVSAVVAFAVQMGAFTAAYAMAGTNIMAGWGLGAIIRLLALAVYALVVVPPIGLPLSPALISLFLFLFLSTLVEPFFLKP